jgi:hypothetical protein
MVGCSGVGSGRARVGREEWRVRRVRRRRSRER